MPKKTYYVNGLMEWRCQIPTGAAIPFIVVEFTGGQFTSHGCAPARFSTEDEVLQHLIEDSYWYDSERIIDHDREAVMKRKKAEGAAAAAAAKEAAARKERENRETKPNPGKDSCR